MKNLPEPEVELIVRSIADNMRTYEQVVEVNILMISAAGKVS